MTTKYAYIHPTTRQYLFTDSADTLLTDLATFAVETYINHYSNGQAYTLVETLPDGSEKWSTPDGTSVPSPADIQAQIEAEIKKRQMFANAGVIPTTTL